MKRTAYGQYEPEPRKVYQFVEFEEVKKMLDERIAPLEKQLRDLIDSLPEYVDTKEALRITGLKQGESLKAARERKDTLIVFKFEGKSCKRPKYLRSSLIAYNNSKVQGRYAGIVQ